MRSTRNIRRLVKNLDLDIDTNTHTDQMILAELLEAQKNSKRTASPLVLPNATGFTVKRPIIKLATAAIVLMACVIGFSLWKSTQSGIALADVLARVEQVRAFRCKGTFKMTGYASPGNPYEWEVYYTYLESQDYGTKVSREVADPNGGKRLLGQSYALPLKKIEIDYIQKKYTNTNLADATAQSEEKGSSRYGDPRAFLTEIVTCKHEALGRSTIDGVEVQGFYSNDPNCRGSGFGFKDPVVDVKVWVDIKTHLPVRYESLKSGLDEMGNRMSHRWIIDDFQWDVRLDASEFEPPVPPDDYIVLEQKPLGPVNEETVISALKQCIGLLGNYPESLSVAPNRALPLELDKSNSPAATQLKEELKELTEVKKAQRIMDASIPMQLLFEFYVGLIENRKDPAYYGEAVTPKDADKVLLRWKLSDNEYRIIYGDLHAETVSPKKLAELEKDLKQ